MSIDVKGSVVITITPEGDSFLFDMQNGVTIDGVPARAFAANFPKDKPLPEGMFELSEFYTIMEEWIKVLGITPEGSRVSEPVETVQGTVH